MEYLTTIEMSKKWGITSRRIAVLCEQGRIVGVVKKGKTWLIPYDSEKPEDARKNTASDVLEASPFARICFTCRTLPYTSGREPASTSKYVEFFIVHHPKTTVLP